MSDFEYWWETEGQYNRAGGSDYEKTFAWEAWNHQQEKINKALKLIKDWEDQTYRDDLEQLLGEIEDILKGYDDE